MTMICSLCGAKSHVSGCGDGFVCETCAESNRVGKDSSTRNAKLMQIAMRGKADKGRGIANGDASDLESYAIASAELFALDEPLDIRPMVACGEVVPQGHAELRDTMAEPGLVALDASAERLALVTQVGIDCAAMALDASETVNASNSLERMAAHQMAVLHRTAMNYAARANLQQDPQNAVKMMNLSIRAIETFQRGMLTFKRLRSSGELKIVIERVSVEGGGQAVIGNVQTGGQGKK